jgi:hypothetical protein
MSKSVLCKTLSQPTSIFISGNFSEVKASKTQGIKNRNFFISKPPKIENQKEIDKTEKRLFIEPFRQKSRKYKLCIEETRKNPQKNPGKNPVN